MNSTGRDFKLGIIGWPLGHSLSPRLHKAALKATGLAGGYTLYPIPPLSEGEKALGKILSQVRSGEIQGLNVTIPHKQNVLALMDDLSPAARKIGAVNTIFLQNGKLLGDNTDWTGFLTDLGKSNPSGTQENHKNALVLGAGGSARAVVYALTKTGWRVTISSRRLEQARHLAEDFSTMSIPIAALPLDKIPSITEVHLIVNTTPAGMTPNTALSPWPADLPFPPGAFVYDLIYNPSETALMKAARAAGLSAGNGLGMLVEQAALAFEIWTGAPAPREVMKHAALERNPL